MYSAGICRRIGLLMIMCAVAAVFALPVRLSASGAGREHALDSLVQVIVETRFGTQRRCSGYMFSANGYVATAFHAVSDARSITVFHPDRGLMAVDEVRRVDRRSDIVVLGTARDEIHRFDVARLADSRSLSVDDPVYIVHHPAFADEAVCSSSISSVGYAKQQPGSYFTGHYADELLLFGCAGPCDVGSVGGLLCNERYEVVGLVLAAGPDSPADERQVLALAANNLAGLLGSTFQRDLSSLRTDAVSDAAYFDLFFGPAPQRLKHEAPMPEGYIAWFAPINHAQYRDPEFTAEINDKIDKNWFYTAGLVIDGRPLREWSASRIFIWDANVNPWNVTDSAEMYVHFDADSLFTKRIYKDRDTEERIMARQVLAMPLAAGQHNLQYENKGANYKSSGIKRVKIELPAAEIHLLDITGLSLVSMLQLPTPVAGVGEGEPVRYELVRRPVQAKELNYGIRMSRYPLQP